MWSGCVALDKLDKNTSEWHNTVHDEYGGVGAPVGLTVFKTAGGSLGAAPGGFDSHTPLPKLLSGNICDGFLEMFHNDDFIRQMLRLLGKLFSGYIHICSSLTYFF
jgi:hypothetical protein